MLTYCVILFSVTTHFYNENLKGGYCIRAHLFPFRTEKLSLIAQMVLPFGGRVCHRLLRIPVIYLAGIFLWNIIISLGEDSGSNLSRS